LSTNNIYEKKLDAQSLRAWLEYYRDIGVSSFYRNGQPDSVFDVLPALETPAPIAHPAPPQPSTFPITPSPQEPDIARASANQLISFTQLVPQPAPIPPAARPAALAAIRGELIPHSGAACTRCALAYAGRHKIVFGDGNPNAELMFVGEGPGADEDEQGIPFVGRAGQLLNNMISAMGLSREEVYIANIVKCRPPSNRVPEFSEATTCSPFLLRQIDVVRPKVIVALGATAATYLLGRKAALSLLRGTWHECRGAKLAVTYHPAFLLRDPRQKKETWKDLQMVMSELGLTPPNSAAPKT